MYMCMWRQPIFGKLHPAPAGVAAPLCLSAFTRALSWLCTFAQCRITTSMQIKLPKTNSSRLFSSALHTERERERERERESVCVCVFSCMRACVCVLTLTSFVLLLRLFRCLAHVAAGSVEQISRSNCCMWHFTSCSILPRTWTQR